MIDIISTLFRNMFDSDCNFCSTCNQRVYPNTNANVICV